MPSGKKVLKKQNNGVCPEEGSYGGFSHKWQYDDYVRSLSGDSSVEKKRVAGRIMTAFCGAGLSLIVVGTISGALTGIPGVFAGTSGINASTLSASAYTALKTADSSSYERETQNDISVPSIGCQCSDMTVEMERIYSLPSGVLVVNATASSELYKNDIITAVYSDADGDPGRAVETAEELLQALSGFEAGDTVYLKVYRRGSEYIIAQPLK